MYKIQVKVTSEKDKWEDLINMPPFNTWDEANIWLTEKKVHLVSDVLEFRITE